MVKEMKTLIGFIVATVLITGAVAQTEVFGPTGNSPSSTSNTGITRVLNEGKALMNKGTNGYNEVTGNGNDRYIKDFVSGKGVAEMIK